MSTSRIRELGYERSISREIAILRTMSHPNVSRLVSSFRFRDGAYLVLEYASGGDLHDLLKKTGSLNDESTKFVIGEVVAALWYVHDMGFIYGDLKPENILVTEAGHVKLTDFGGCRAATETARDMIRPSAGTGDVLRTMRDGDWRERPSADAEKEDGVEDGISKEKEDEEEEDTRIEGTTAYLPPEVIAGCIPTLSADSWALGCVLYQCLSGRPPLLGDDDAHTARRIVTFELSSSEEDSEEGAGEDDDDFFRLGNSRRSSGTFCPESRSLIRRLLKRDPNSRPPMPLIAGDPFFDGVDVTSLHAGPAQPLNVGVVTAASGEDINATKWTRRQFSSIWAPQPRPYDVGSAGTSSGGGGTMSARGWRDAPIPEGGERNLPFLLTNRPAAGLKKINEA